MSRLLSREALTSLAPWSGAPKHGEAFTRCKGKDTCSGQRVQHVQSHRDVGGRGWRSHAGPVRCTRRGRDWKMLSLTIQGFYPGSLGGYKASDRL